MKALLYLTSLISMLLITSCKKDGINKKDIKGEWNITSFSYVGNDGNDYEYLGMTTGDDGTTYHTRMAFDFSINSFILDQKIEAIQNENILKIIPLSTFWGQWELEDEVDEITLNYGMQGDDLSIYDGTSLANFLASNTEVADETYHITISDEQLVLETTIKGLDFRIEAERME